jgi:hypothetical protein
MWRRNDALATCAVGVTVWHPKYQQTDMRDAHNAGCKSDTILPRSWPQGRCLWVLRTWPPDRPGCREAHRLEAPVRPGSPDVRCGPCRQPARRLRAPRCRRASTSPRAAAARTVAGGRRGPRREHAQRKLVEGMHRRIEHLDYTVTLEVMTPPAA